MTMEPMMLEHGTVRIVGAPRSEPQCLITPPLGECGVAAYARETHATRFAERRQAVSASGPAWSGYTLDLVSPMQWPVWKLCSGGTVGLLPGNARGEDAFLRS